MTSGMGGEIDLGSLSIQSCIDNFSLPSNDNATAAMPTNASSSWNEMCDILLSSLNLVRPTHDPRHHVRQMLNYLLMGVAGMTVACFGLIGNLLSAIVLTRRTMTTSTYCYLAALAVCDFLVVACTLVLLIKDARRPEPESTGWPPSNLGNFHPYVFPYLHPAAITLQVSSVWLTLAFTVDRYIMICHPFRSEMFCTVSRAKRVIAALVISSVLFNLPKFFEYRTVVIPPPLTAVQLSAAEDVAVVEEDLAVVGSDLTEFGRSRVFKQLYHSWFYIVFVFGVPFVSLVVLNAFLVNAVRMSNKFLVNAVRMSRQRSRDLRPTLRRNAPDLVASAPAYQLEGNASSLVHGSSRSTEKTICQTNFHTLVRKLVHLKESRSDYQIEHGGRLSRKSSMEDIKTAASPGYQLEGLGTPEPRPESPVSRRIDTTVMLIGVVIIFIVCQFPALVSRAIWAFSDDPSRAFTELPLYSLNEIANFLVLLNSSVNIVPYYFFGRRFRRQFLALFCPCCTDRRRTRCDSMAVDSALFSHSASMHHRDISDHQHHASSR